MLSAYVKAGFNHQLVEESGYTYGVGPANDHQMKQQVIPGMSMTKHTYPLSTKVTSGAFLEKMTSEQLALWLSHHTYMVGTDYLVDVEKLKGI